LRSELAHPHGQHVDDRQRDEGGAHLARDRPGQEGLAQPACPYSRRPPRRLLPNSVRNLGLRKGSRKASSSRFLRRLQAADVASVTADRFDGSNDRSQVAGRAEFARRNGEARTGRPTP